MTKHGWDFEDDYKGCNGVFVLMGDASRVAVAGYSTCCMKIDDNITQVLNSLYVPGLDTTSFSDGDDTLISDSGATSTIMKYCWDFEDDYKTCD